MTFPEKKVLLWEHHEDSSSTVHPYGFPSISVVQLWRICYAILCEVGFLQKTPSSLPVLPLG